MIQHREELTAREHDQMQHEKAMLTLQAEHTQKIKAMELEVAKLEAKWSNIYKLPLTLIKLPLYIVLGVAYCIAAARKHEPSDNFWRLLH